MSNMSNFEALVIQDLKDLGIRLPKNKKESEADTSCQVSEKCVVFGTHLRQLPSIVVENVGPVPRFLVGLISLVERNIDCEGIFRKSSSVSRTRDLRVKVDAGDDISDASALDLGSLLKQFLRDLPEPLLTTYLQECFLSCYDITLASKRLEAVMLLCLLLPEQNLATLRYVTDFLNRVAAHCAYNKMDAKNIAVCLAPSIFHDCCSGKLIAAADGESAKSSVAAPTAIIELLIEHSSQIGVVNNDLRERLELMTACFSDSIFEQNKMNVSENREKKRSGSFQGLISNLSHSFIKWRNKEKDKLNASTSTLYSSSTIAPASAPVAFSDDMNCISLTPVVIRKRKAEEEPIPFSTGKKLAILQNMPQMSVLAATPYMTRKKGDVSAHSSVITNQKFSADDLSLVSGNRHRVSPFTSQKDQRDGFDTSPKSPQTSKNKVRKSFEGLLRRLSGGKDSQINEKLETLRDRNLSHLPQRSPSAPSFPSSPLRDRSPYQISITHQSLLSCQNHDLSETNEPDVDDHLNSRRSKVASGSARQRSMSADGVSLGANTSLRRGRPNTVKSGLPSPLHRRPSTDYDDFSQSLLAANPVSLTSAAIIDTSPIVGETVSCVFDVGVAVVSPPVERQICDANEVDLADDLNAESLNEAFIGSDAFSTVEEVSASSLKTVFDNVSGSSVSIETEPYGLPSDSCRRNDVLPYKLDNLVRDSSLCHKQPLRDPMEKYVSMRQRSLEAVHSLSPITTSSSSSFKSAPKIKPSLMSDTISKRLFVNKTNSPASASSVASTNPYRSPVCVRRPTTEPNRMRK